MVYKLQRGQEDVAEFEGSKLTRRKQATGNLKRKVSDKLQEDFPAIDLSSK